MFGAINKHSKEIGFTPVKSDPCIYIYSVEGGLVSLILYGDDLLLLL